MTRTEFDAIVIGGGSGRLPFAQSAAARGARIALIERDRLGGTRVHRRCVPKKMLWIAARTLHDLAGLSANTNVMGQARVDKATLSRQRCTKIYGIVEYYGEKLGHAGVTRIKGTARVAGGQVSVDGQLLSAECISLATGGRPAHPSCDGADLCDISDDALAWTTVARRLAIIGGRYIGCELAVLQAAFGAEVTLISDADTVLTEFSKGWQKIGADNLLAQEVTPTLGCKTTEVTATHGELRLTLDDGAVLTFDNVLLATGRDVNTDVLGDLGGRVTLTNFHFATDDSLLTSNPNPNQYAVGDCADHLPLTHFAVDDGRVLAERLFGNGADPVSRDLVATAAFLLPPVAETGQRDLLSQNNTSTPLKNAVLQNDSCDFWAYGSNDGTLPAVSLLSEGAPEAIGIAAQLIAAHHSIRQFANALPVYPTMTEGLLTAPYS